ncbi:MAG: MerR family transcriptional regulator, partial [Acidimicrobiia bacterium]
PESLKVALEARRLLEHGLEARHLRAVLLGVEREAELLRQLTAPLLRLHHPEARRRVRDTLAGCAEAMQAMHRSLLAARLRALLED